MFHVPRRLFDGGTFIGIFEVVPLRDGFAVMTGAEFFRICQPKRCSRAILNMHAPPAGGCRGEGERRLDHAVIFTAAMCQINMAFSSCLHLVEDISRRLTRFGLGTGIVPMG